MKYKWKLVGGSSEYAEELLNNAKTSIVELSTENFEQLNADYTFRVTVRENIAGGRKGSAEVTVTIASASDLR